MNNTLKVGLFGLGITLSINLAGLLLRSQPATIFFSLDWWATWSPAYLVWSILSVVGIKYEVKRRFELILDQVMNTY